MHYLNQSVYSDRYTLLQDEMKAKELDAVLSVNADNINYFTGYWLGSAFFGTWERPAFFLMTGDGGTALVANKIITNSVRDCVEHGSCNVNELHFYAEQPNALGQLTDWVPVLVGALKAHGVSGRIGIDVSPASVPAQLKAALPQVEFIPVGDFVTEMRFRKAPAELSIIKVMAELSDWAQEVFKSNLKIGRSNPEVSYRTLAEVGTKAAQQYPRDKIEIKVWCHAGPDSVNIPNTPHYYGRPLAPGDSLINIIICRMNSYVAENERTFIIGEPSPRQIEVFDVMRRAQEASISACVVGTPVSEVDRRPREVIEQAGYGDCMLHRAGHGIGLNGHEYPIATAFDQRLFVPGVVMSCEPGIYIPGLGGFRHSDTVIVGETQPEIVTHYPRDLQSLVIR